MKNLIILSLCLFLSACGGVTDKGDTETSATQTQENTDVSAEISPEDTGIIAPSAPGLDSWTDLTSKVSQEYKTDAGFLYCAAQSMDNCINETANIRQKEVACDDYVLDSTISSCKESRILTEAVESLDASICEKLSSNAQGCKLEVTIKKSIQAGDPKACETLEKSNARNCNNAVIKSIAIEKKDVSLCKDMQGFNEGDTIEKEACIQEIQFIIEEEKRNKELLEDIEQQALSPPPVLDSPPPPVN